MFCLLVSLFPKRLLRDINIMIITIEAITSCYQIQFSDMNSLCVAKSPLLGLYVLFIQ